MMHFASGRMGVSSSGSAQHTRKTKPKTMTISTLTPQHHPHPHLKCLTYNIHAWMTSNMAKNLHLVHKVLKWQDADIMALNEVSDEVWPMDTPHVASDLDDHHQGKGSTLSSDTTTTTNDSNPQNGLIIGDTKESSSHQKTPLSRLASRLKCNYIYGHADYCLGNAILFKRDRFEMRRCSVHHCVDLLGMEEEEPGIQNGERMQLSGEEQVNSSAPENRSLTHVTLRDLKSNYSIDVFVTHLDHQSDEYRLAMMQAFAEKITMIQEQSMAEEENYMGCILLGDLNAMTRSDYSDEYVREIENFFRKRFKAEALDFETTAFIRGEHKQEDTPQLESSQHNSHASISHTPFLDTWKCHNRSKKDEECTTSRIDTRIDYIFSKCLLPTLDSKIISNSLNASDHHPVCTTFSTAPRISFIKRGLTGQLAQQNLEQCFPSLMSRGLMQFLDLPESTSESIEILSKHLCGENVPELLIACSEGTEIVCSLFSSQNRCTSIHPHTKFLLISPTQQCKSISTTNATLFVHDNNTSTDHIRNLVAQSKFSQLVKADSILSDTDQLFSHMIRAINMTTGVNDQTSTQPRIFLTGFGPFAGVADNPTSLVCQHVINNRDKYPNIRNVQVLEVSIEGVSKYFEKLPQLLKEETSPGDDVILLHLGVAASAPEFKIEQCGVNEASFRVADMRGLQPMMQPICSTLGTEHCHYTSIQADKLASMIDSHLHSSTNGNFRCGNDPSNKLAATSNRMIDGNSGSKSQHAICCTSTNAGRFLCNYIFYQSLEFSSKLRENSAAHQPIHSLFCHVPSLETYSVEKQIAFFNTLHDTLSNNFATLS